MVYWLEVKLGLKFYHWPSLKLDRFIGQSIHIGLNQGQANISYWLSIADKISA